MTAEILRLSGLDDGKATQAAEDLLADRGKHPFLRRTLVIDDSAALFRHSGIYELLLTSKRMDHLLCIALGPRDPQSAAGREPRLRIPPNISSQQGSAVLWVADPLGIDVSLSATLADGHPDTPLTGLEYLLQVLSVDEVFDKVRSALATRVRSGVASPGLHLAGAEDEILSFRMALTQAIRRITGAGVGLAAGAEDPYPVLLPDGAQRVTLAEDGELAQYRNRIADSAASAAGKRKGHLLRRDRSDPRDDAIALGQDLRAFRDRVVQLLAAGQSTGELTEAQRGEIAQAGVVLPAPPPVVGPGEQPLVARTVDAAVRSGDTLPRVIRRLTYTAKLLKHEGSASYRPRVEQVCSQALLNRLTGPPPRPQGKADAEGWLHGLGLSEAGPAAAQLAALVAEVAHKEWAGGPTSADEITRFRIVLEGITKRLTEHAADAGQLSVAGAQAARISRLSESLVPILLDLVERVFAVEAAAPSPGGQQAYDRAYAKTGEMLAEWLSHVSSKGHMFRPPFATSVVRDSVYADDEIVSIREALRYDPRQVMWQLCGPADLGALSVKEPLNVVAFAPQQTKEALRELVPKDTTWTGFGSQAGLLRLVPLRSSAVWAEWADGDAERGRPGDTPPEL
jgi:hypothetical protein